MITTEQKSWTLNELKDIPVITQEEFDGSWMPSSRWQPVQHGTLVETIYESLDEHDIRVLDERWYATGRDFQRLSGSMELQIPGLEPMEGTRFSLGVQHSNLGDRALKFAVGAKIFICSNGMVVGDYAVKRKHTTGIDLMELIGIGVKTYINKARTVKEVAENMRAIEMGTADVDKALMAAGRQGLMSWSRIGQVDREYNKPTFADHNEKTAWGLHNAFTYIIQKMPPQYHLKSMNNFRKLLTEGAA